MELHINQHVHSDTFNFIYIQNQPFIVDTGTSTYEKMTEDS